MQGLIPTVLVLALATAACQPAIAPAPEDTAGQAALTRVEGLGAISFPNSGEAAAQAPFIRGVLLLHSFEYEPAAEAFREAQKADPDFALAYWGEAMTHNHPLWQQVDVEAARAILARLGDRVETRAAKAGTERERKFLAAVEALYGAGDKTTRDLAYMDAMARLSADFPDDMEARAFHALSVIGSRNGTRDFATYMRAAAIAQPVFDQNPDHPGAAHYLIHAFDDPVHAPLGLPAARKYATTAPGAAHAQHMTSHIFVALGMWDDVVAANIRARDRQDADNAAHGDHANVCGHYSSWLHYGHLMKGETAQAEALMDRCHERLSHTPTPAEQNYFNAMRARQILDTEDWAAASRWTWTPPAGDANGAAARRLEYAFTNAFAALRRGDASEARAVLATPAPPGEPSRLHREALRGLVAIASGRTDEGLAILRAAAAAEDAMPYEFGPPRILKPTHELLGEELLRAGRLDEARAAFRRATERTPGRTLAVRGLAAAAAAPPAAR
jgi:tetratricopeptide (TPR) repeat protein